MTIYIGWVIQFVVAFFATISFGILFHVPTNQFLCAGLTGAVGWLCYIISVQYGLTVAVASFLAALVLTVMSRVFAVARKAPITIFLICGIFPLVPGAGIYYTAYYFIMAENAQAADKGVETLKIAVAIALGIVFILSLPNSLFSALGRRLEKPRQG